MSQGHGRSSSTVVDPNPNLLCQSGHLNSECHQKTGNIFDKNSPLPLFSIHISSSSIHTINNAATTNYSSPIVTKPLYKKSPLPSYSVNGSRSKGSSISSYKHHHRINSSWSRSLFTFQCESCGNTIYEDNITK
jgi:hypothetical protein